MKRICTSEIPATDVAGETQAEPGLAALADLLEDARAFHHFVGTGSAVRKDETESDIVGQLLFFGYLIACIGYLMVL